MLEKQTTQLKPNSQTETFMKVVTLFTGLSTMTKTMKMPFCLALLTACFTLSGPSLMTRPSDTITNNWARSLLLDDWEQFDVSITVAKSTSWPTRVFFCSNENSCSNLKVKHKASSRSWHSGVVGYLPQHYTVALPRQLELESSSLWTPQVSRH